MKIIYSSKKHVSLSPVQQEKIENFIKNQVISDSGTEGMDSDSVIVCDDVNSFLSEETLLNNLVKLQGDALQLEERLNSLREYNEDLEEKVRWLRDKANSGEPKPQSSGKSRKQVGLVESNHLHSAFTQIINKMESDILNSRTATGFMFKRAKIAKKDKLLVANSEYFSQPYLYGELKKLGLEIKQPLEFFMEFGAVLQLSPSDKFDAEAYLSMNPDVRESGMNPLLHYLKHGKQEGRVLI